MGPNDTWAKMGRGDLSINAYADIQALFNHQFQIIDMVEHNTEGKNTTREAQAVACLLCCCSEDCLTSQDRVQMTTSEQHDRQLNNFYSCASHCDSSLLWYFHL